MTAYVNNATEYRRCLGKWVCFWKTASRLLPLGYRVTKNMVQYAVFHAYLATELTHELFTWNTQHCLIWLVWPNHSFTKRVWIQINELKTAIRGSHYSHVLMFVDTIGKVIVTRCMLMLAVLFPLVRIGSASNSQSLRFLLSKKWN